jgi:alkylation response protein AidB-like acyl-CoA dehydrogenase
MEFGLSEDQRLFDSSLRAFLAGHLPMEARREAARHGADPCLWEGLCGLGLAGLLVPEEFGGAGLGLMDAALAAEALGHAAAPAPFLGTAVLAPLALCLLGSTAQQAQWLPRIAAGELRFGLGFGARWPARPAAIRSGSRPGACRARRLACSTQPGPAICCWRFRKAAWRWRPRMRQA